jgi:hypothetical protein
MHSATPPKHYSKYGNVSCVARVDTPLKISILKKVSKSFKKAAEETGIEK